ncbi:DUF4145 domain-containing protein [Patescibacteria group bacterium]|nr:DUF4145 domain-containing protein [Patescibacteria group bacterium]
MKNNYFQPEFKKTSFTCPHCGVLSTQKWLSVTKDYYSGKFGAIYESLCQNEDCNKYCLWIDEKMIIPDQEGITYPNEDLSEDIQKDYLEARSIISKSPRGAAALLRLAIQKLCKQLGELSEDINTDIGNLVKKGLRPSIQKALDIVRVTGNESVHPGVIDLNDNREIALKLFDLVNLIAEVMISEPKRIDELYDTVIPETKKKAITKRDEAKISE